VINVPLGHVGAWITATLLDQNVKGLGILRTLFYLPAVLPAATALLWRWILTSDGLINEFISSIHHHVGVDRPRWLPPPTWCCPPIS
jgi:multiple sugar transport system permease protein